MHSTSGRMAEIHYKASPDEFRMLATCGKLEIAEHQMRAKLNIALEGLAFFVFQDEVLFPGLGIVAACAVPENQAKDHWSCLGAKISS